MTATTNAIHPRVKRQKVTQYVPPAFAGPQKIQHPYYDFGRVLSFHAIVNMIIGARGRGKSFGAKRRSLRNATNPKKREQFIYVRRYEPELSSIRTFFADIAHEFPEWDFRVNGRQFEMSPVSMRDQKQRPWDVIGYAVALSTSQQNKSVAYPKVTTVIFDEFIIEKGLLRYLPDEWTIFMNLLSTIDRYQDKTVALLLANSVRIENPYFLANDIQVGKNDEFIKFGISARTGLPFGIVHIDHDENFSESVFNTRYGEFIQGSTYADYAVGNEFIDNTDRFVREKPLTAKHWFNLVLRTGKMGIWEDGNTSEMFATSWLPENQLTLSLVPETLTEEQTLVFANDPVIKQLLSAFRNKHLWFDKAQLVNIFLDVLRMRNS